MKQEQNVNSPITINTLALEAGIDRLQDLITKYNGYQGYGFTVIHDDVFTQLTIQVRFQERVLFLKEIELAMPDSVAVLEATIKSIELMLPPITKSARKTIAPVIQLSSGELFNFKRPSDTQFDIEVIAHALSHLCRFNGHCREFYSVAQHSVLVSQIVPFEHQMAALLHDASEAFIGDVTSPLKALLPNLKDIETNIQRVLFEYFGLPFPMHQCIKDADMRMQATEVRDLMILDCEYWSFNDEYEPCSDFIIPWAPETAKNAFLTRFHELHQQMNGLSRNAVLA